MDPNANLKEQEAACVWLATHDAAGDRHMDDQTFATWRDTRRQLRALRTALRQWLSRGGFEPDWTQYPIAARYFGR